MSKFDPLLGRLRTVDEERIIKETVREYIASGGGGASSHSELTGVTSDQHHTESHTLASHSSKAHSDLTGIGTDDHHAKLHGHDGADGSGTVSYNDLSDLPTLVTDHGTLTGLTDDDHTQYQKETDFTQGSILFRGASAITEDNANLFWDDSNNRLGIGTTSPDFALEVVNSTSSQMHLATSDIDQGLFGLGTASAAFVSGNAAWNGSAWVAKGTSASIFGNLTGAFNVYTDSGLTAGNTFSPTLRLSVSNAGNTTINGALAIDGRADVEQLVVQAHSTQTNKLQVWEDSTGADVGYMKGTGDFAIVRRLFFRAPTESPKNAIEHDGSKFEFIVAGSVRLSITNANNFFVGRTTANSGVVLNSSAYSVVGTGGSDVVTTFRSASGQTGDFIRLENSTPTTIGRITAGGDLKLEAVGGGVYLKEGTNATMGTATLSGGTVTVSTTKVTANSRIFLTPQGGGANRGFVVVSARTAGTSFTILSNNVLDTNDVAWLIVEPA